MKLYSFSLGAILVILGFSKVLTEGVVDTSLAPLPQHTRTPYSNLTEPGWTISSIFNIFRLISTSDVFIDKTALIKTFIESPQDQRYVLFTAPTKFGKSAIISMLLNFLELPITNKGELLDKTTTVAHRLFYESADKFAISSDNDFKERHFAQYPVIYLSFGGNLPHLVGAEGAEGEQKLLNHVAKIIEISILRYKPFILNSNASQEAKELLKMLDRVDFDLHSLGSLLYNFNEVLQKATKRSTIFLVDKYDILIQVSLSKKGDAVFAAHLMETLFTSLMRNSSVSYAFVAGISNLIRAEKSSSLVNVLKSYPFLKDHQYTDFAGVTENELLKLFAKFNLSTPEQDKVKTYYNAYSTEQEKRKLYSIYSISGYIEQRKHNQSLPLRPIWGTSGVNGGVFLLTGLYVCMKDTNVRKQIEDSHSSMNEIIEATIDHKISIEQLQLLMQMFEFDDSFEHQYDLFYTLALELGLFSYGQSTTKLKVPNEDVRFAFYENLIRPFSMANFTTINPE